MKSQKSDNKIKKAFANKLEIKTTTTKTTTTTTDETTNCCGEIFCKFFLTLTKGHASILQLARPLKLTTRVPLTHQPANHSWSTSIAIFISSTKTWLSCVASELDTLV